MMTRPDLLMTVLSAVAVLLLTLLCGLAGLPLLRRLRVGQVVRDDGPQSHLNKSGTPTFGGFFFLLPLAGLGLLSLLHERMPHQAGLIILLMLLFGLVGFIDDWIKVRVSRKGLSIRQKTLLMLLISTAFSVYYLYLAPEAAFFLLPVSGHKLIISGWFRLPYAIFVILVLFFTSNSVNLTDGVDGLAASVTILAGIAFWVAGAWLLPQTAGTLAGSGVALALAAGCLGFLVFNRHPAKVFMGDTGSQALGAGIAGIALLFGAPWLILLIGVIYVAESFSVIIQVIYFKRTGGRRIFRMSPIHHHFELGGWPEQKIVRVFSAVTLAGCLAGLLLL